MCNDNYDEFNKAMNEASVSRRDEDKTANSVSITTEAELEAYIHKVKSDFMVGTLYVNPITPSLKFKMLEDTLLEGIDSYTAHAELLADIEEQEWLDAPTGEYDPNGIHQNEPGAKCDAGKNQLGLVLGDFANALMKTGKVGTDGAIKYTPHGWLEVENGQDRYMDAAFRHLLQHQSGELIDKDSGSEHLAHVAWNILAVLELGSRDEECNL